MRNEAKQDKPLFFGTGRAILIVSAIILFGVALKYWNGDIEKWGQYLSGAGTLGLVLAGLYAAAAAIKAYDQNLWADRRKNDLEKAKWLSQLFQSFYEKDTYKGMRRKFDFGNMDDVLGLIRKDSGTAPVFHEEEQILFDQFTDYLNFFELVAYLSKLEQLDSEDIKAVFAYYLGRLVKIDTTTEIRTYIETNGYGNLSRTLKGYTSLANGTH